MGNNGESNLNQGHQEDFDKATDNAERRRVIQAQIDNTQTAINLKLDAIAKMPQLEGKLRADIAVLQAKIDSLEVRLRELAD